MDRLQAWEAAYRRFETPEEERSKFIKRLKVLGVGSWDRNTLITELFCGRGSGLDAWQRLGFRELEGVDISPRLLREYEGPARTYVADAKQLPFPDQSRAVICVHGGLHHLVLMEELEQALSEIRRVLEPGGRLVLVEPWLTPFLRFVHWACSVSLLRKLWGRLDALAEMKHLERETYDDWHSKPELVLGAIKRTVEPTVVRLRWGKLMLIGTQRDARRHAESLADMGRDGDDARSLAKEAKTTEAC